MPNKKELDSQVLELVEKDRLQTTAVVAHEILKKIKSPLSLIRGRAESLVSQLEPQHQDNARRILEQITNLEGLLQSISAFTASASLHKEEVFIFEIMEELVEFFQIRLSQSNIHVLNLVPRDLKIVTAKSDLKTILRSTLLNAIEALEEAKIEHKNIFIQTQQSDGHQIITIEDNGPGIQSSLLRNLFQPFFTTKKDHVGLSLAICRKIAEKENWKFKVMSRHQLGTQVELWLS